MLTLSSTFFILITLSVLPFYSLMIFTPSKERTRNVMGSLWPFAVPVSVYSCFLLLILILARPDVISLWRELYVTRGLFGTSTVQFLSDTYGSFPEFAALHGWAHILVGDIFMARWAFLDASEHAVSSLVIVAIVVLIGFLGPVGVLVYLLVRKRIEVSASRPLNS